MFMYECICRETYRQEDRIAIQLDTQIDNMTDR